MGDAQAPDVFISYARSAEPHAKLVATALRDRGYNVWWDDDLPAHRSYGEVIEERLSASRAVLVLWSRDAAKSEWVRAEADSARQARKLVQLSTDGSLPPMPFNQIQCPWLVDWTGNPGDPAWQKVEGSIAELLNGKSASPGEPKPAEASGPSICVLPFTNMSGDSEQEYFSDGITEDLTTDLSRISALSVVSRNTSFTFKGKAAEITSVARQLNVSHVLEGSVRKAGKRLRITAQLIDGGTGRHLWPQRYDRDLTDIFEIQDEISLSIVEALKLRLLTEEKNAISDRGTLNVEAYNLYLMARQHWIAGTFGDVRRDEAIVRICRQATSLDPNYARAWALMAIAQSELRFWHGRPEHALPAAERALSLDATLPEPYCVKARYLEEDGRQSEADREIATALQLDPESWEVNRKAARMKFRQGSAREAVPYFAKAAALMDTDYHNQAMLTSCYDSLGEKEAFAAAARVLLERVEQAVAKDPTNASALASGVGAVLMSGDRAQAKEWIERALILDPDNLSMRYNLACALTVHLNDADRALEVLRPFFESVKSASHIKHLEADPDFDSIRARPEFQDMLARAKERLQLGISTQE